MHHVFAVSPVLSAGQDVEVVAGTPLVLTVNITEFNLPLSEITWFIDGTPATTAITRITITATSTISPPTTSTLTLDPVMFPNEGGVYSVRAINPAGMNTTFFNVTITCESLLSA